MQLFVTREMRGEAGTNRTTETSGTSELDRPRSTEVRMSQGELRVSYSVRQL